MDMLYSLVMYLLDVLYLRLISPLFTLAGRGLELVLLRPLELIGLSAQLQVVGIALATVALSLTIRRLLRVEEKEARFQQAFAARHGQHDDLHLVSDWKSREAMARVIDDDLDIQMNTYLAERFARYGTSYLLPPFLTLFWLQTTLQPAQMAVGVPGWPAGPQVSGQFLFLLTYVLGLLSFFQGRRIWRRRRPDVH